MPPFQHCQPSSFPESIVPYGIDSAIFAILAAYNADSHPQKVNLSVGAYRDSHLKPWILPTVRRAKERLSVDKVISEDRLPCGLQPFSEAAARVLFGKDSTTLRDNRVLSVHTAAATGAIHVAAEFLDIISSTNSLTNGSTKDSGSPGISKTVYIPAQTWPGHFPIFGRTGIATCTYNYYDPSTYGVDFPSILSCLENAPEGSIVLLHAVGHNPTGCDPTHEQWSTICSIMLRRELIPFFDLAYQGIVSGSLDEDAWSVRHFAKACFPRMLVAQSFSKNMGLYSEHAGCLHYILGSTPSTTSYSSNMDLLGQIQAYEFGSPATYGAQIAVEIMNDQELYTLWLDEMASMAARLVQMRKMLKKALDDLDTPSPSRSSSISSSVPNGDTPDPKTKPPQQPQSQRDPWQHIVEQTGMFAYTGLTEEQVAILRDEGHIHMLGTGRISVAGLNEENIGLVAKWIDHAVRKTCKQDSGEGHQAKESGKLQRNIADGVENGTGKHGDRTAKGTGYSDGIAAA